MNKTGCVLLIAGLLLGGMPEGWASPFIFTDTAVNSASLIGLPPGMTSLVQAVNVGSITSNTVNGITFAADSGNWPPSNGEGNFTGNGYTAHGFTESAGGVAGANFTQTTINFGSTGYLHGDGFTGLSPNTDYVFQLFLSDFHTQRGAQFTYALGSTTEIQDISQTLGNENLYQVAFNSGGNTTFSWALDPITGFHDGKVAGFALFAAAPIPEPAAFAAGVAGAVLVVAAGRRRAGRGGKGSPGRYDARDREELPTP